MRDPSQLSPTPFLEQAILMLSCKGRIARTYALFGATREETMKRLVVIGIGAGNPDYMTIQAIDALNSADVVFVFDKGPLKRDLVRIRKEICDRFLRRAYRLVEVPSPERDATGPSYKASVEDWHREKSAIIEGLIATEVADGQCGAFLVWGDPSLYDSTLRILGELAVEGSPWFDYEVIPGISSVQALAARHRIPLNAIGAPVHITTGRRLAEGLPADADSVVVLLDSGSGLHALDRTDAEIFWGAYLGTADEVLVSGKVSEVLDDILRIRKRAKAEKGWIMDAYLLRRSRR
jgi:precorrin-6A synthase